MPKIVSHAIVLCAGLTLSACVSMTSPRYSSNSNNNVLLRKLQNASIAVVEQVDQSHFEAQCRMAAPITPSDNRTIAQFVADSFNDEFKFAQVYGNQPGSAKLVLQLDKAKFSSSSGLTNGWWELDVTLRNTETSESVTVSTHYDFPTAFDGLQACNMTAQALTPAVQDLIQKVVLQRDFRRMVRADVTATTVAK